MSADLDTLSLMARLDVFLSSRSWSLPVCADTAEGLLGRLGEAPDRERVHEVAMSDPTLLTSLLCDANSSDFDGLEPTASVVAALARVGVARAHALLRGVLVDACFEGNPVLRVALDQSRRRALAVARSAVRIAGSTGHEMLDAEAEVLGLISELGSTFLVAALQARIDESGAPLTDFATQEVFAQLQRGYRNRLLELWKFPRRAVEILSERASGAEERRLARILELARRVVASAGLPALGSGPSEEVESELWELAEGFELSNVELAALLVRAEDVVAALDGGAVRTG